MRLGTYIVSGLVLMLIVGGAAYLITPASYSLSVLGINIHLPIAVWVLLPMALLYLVTILHMAYHGTRDYLRKRKLLQDTEELKDALYWSLLKEPKEHRYSTPQMREGASLLNVSRLEVTGSIHGLSEKLSKTLEWVREIEGGTYVDLKAKKIERFLSRENPLLIRNQLNRLEQEKGFAEEVLQSKEFYDEAVARKALEILVTREDLYKLKKYIPFLSKEQLFTILDRVDAGEEIGFSQEMLEAFIAPFKLDCRDFMRIARTTHKQFTPDQNLALFKRLAKEQEKAQNAYLYLLFEYEMLDNARQFLEEHDEQEFKSFRAFFILKRGKYHYKIDDLIDIDIACR
ncbi:hypothetical protein [Nitratifractor sp.]